MANLLSQLTKDAQARLLEELNYLNLEDEHLLLTAEYAYLTDLKGKRAGSDWESLRKAKAASALKTLARIAPS